MKTIMLTAMQSHAGKTVLTCALLQALKKRGLSVGAFKCGPDYIDPMFHREVLGVAGHNLDLFLQGDKRVKETFERYGGDIAVIEGAMGYYDGVAGTCEASAYALHQITGGAVILVLSRPAAALTCAAQVKGLKDFRADGGISAVIFQNCPKSLASYLTPVMEREAGLPVLGYLSPMEEAVLESRHLGLVTAGEIGAFRERVQKLGEVLEQTVDIEKLLALSEEKGGKAEGRGADREAAGALAEEGRCRIAVARDEAFCFCYEESLRALRCAGAEIVFFSPIRDTSLPDDIAGLYLCGGYPELYAEKLSRNEAMRRQIREAVQGGLPTIAECGGFMYLMQSLENEERKAYPMCAVLPGEAFKTGRLQRFGYQYLSSAKDSLLFRKGEKIPAHEFHYWDSTQNGCDLLSEKPGGRSWACGYATKTLYAAFPHLHLGGELPLARRFMEACR